MRRILLPLLVLAQLTWGVAAIAQEQSSASSTNGMRLPTTTSATTHAKLALPPTPTSAPRPPEPAPTETMTLLHFPVVPILKSFFVPEKKTRLYFLVGTERLHAVPVSVGSGYGMAAGGHF